MLTVPKRLVEAFKKKARERFPVEVYAVLIGHDYHDKIEVLEFFYPDFKASKHYVYCEDQGYVDAKDSADELGLRIVGDIHSHCYDSSIGADHAKSEIDHAWGHKLRIQGICRVVESSGGRRRATTKFWGPTIPVDCRLKNSREI